MREVAAGFIKPNDRLTSLERLEIYNRQYWFRMKDCFYDDYPGLRAVLGDRRFERLACAYLARHPSESFTPAQPGPALGRISRGRTAMDRAQDRTWRWTWRAWNGRISKRLTTRPSRHWKSSHWPGRTRRASACDCNPTLRCCGSTTNWTGS